jgi:NAD-dependent deacetylase
MFEGEGAADAMTPAEQLSSLLSRSSRAVVFTGAGISTESGIPDFRSPGGVWSKMSPIDFRQFVSDPELRRESWRRTFSGVTRWQDADPNAGHFAISRLVAQGKVGAVITQNVDNLHQASGVPPEKVIELHGNATYAACLECGERHELAELKEPFLATGEPPACRACAGVVKSATISFGQAMPEAEMARAQKASLACDLFIVLGSSLVVYPAADFPLIAKRNGAALVIVNREPTPQDPYADLVLHEELGPLLTKVAPPVN